MTASTSREREIEAEQRHVDRVYDRLAELRAEAQELRSQGYRRGQERHPGALFERDVMVFQASRMLRELETEHEGLVFGRLDLVGGQAQYVGRLGVRDPDFEPLVIDWRAPAASAFYRATPEDPMDVVRRRSIRSFGQRVLDLTDDLLMPDAAPDEMPVVGEGSLMADLSRARGPAMRDIVSTIQREQDVAVRAPAGGITEITGGPGTGKTAVALHRAAYLLYADRRRFSGGVLVVGPSPVFMDYISRVLPSLGEDTVELRSLGEVLDGVSASRMDPQALSELKGAGRMRRLMKSALAMDPPSAPTELRIVYRGQVLKLDARALTEVRQAVHRMRVTPNRARREAATAVLDALWRSAQGQPDAPRREPLVSDLGDRSEFERFMGQWWPELRPTDVLGWLGDRARLASIAGRGFTGEQLTRLAESWRQEPDGDQNWSVADVALLDELRTLAGERGEGRRGREFFFGHVILDEAQDLSPMQWRMLGRRGQYASWTIVGDPAQSSWPDADEAHRAREAALGKVKTRRHFRLSTNYRNSAEIFSLAASVVRGEVPDEELPTPVRTTGWEPSVRTVAVADLPVAAVGAAEELLAEVEGTVGVITTMAGRAEASGWLDELIEKSDGRLRVVGSLEAKGLEYDAVLLVQPSDLIAESSTGRRALYVALSRATQRLTVLADDNSWRA
ncbi:HelD family protein [Pseudonocardia spinosispora]|uniref:HelD family protein n=1 Tax=Pseudonocardia spinosispora TaxID=103441 RepID=UPI0003F88D25|nr:ATP-binding domain-containing protein [Pseudonocardia spinosispora]